MSVFKADDIIAALILSIAMFRRLEAVSIRREDNQQVSDADFATWRRRAVAGYNRIALACVLKIVISVAWFQLFQNTSGVLQVGGLVIFVAWVVTVVMTWRPLTEASAMRKRLGIGHPHEPAPPS
jgi:predicted anti-sigma-YlaC factor YlaD